MTLALDSAERGGRVVPSSLEQDKTIIAVIEIQSNPAGSLPALFQASSVIH